MCWNIVSRTRYSLIPWHSTPWQDPVPFAVIPVEHTAHCHWKKTSHNFSHRLLETRIYMIIHSIMKFWINEKSSNIMLCCRSATLGSQSVDLASQIHLSFINKYIESSNFIDNIGTHQRRVSDCSCWRCHIFYKDIQEISHGNLPTVWRSLSPLPMLETRGLAGLKMKDSIFAW